MEHYTLPNWVFKRDGRLVPFEADKISQALFAATEAQGRPNAFLARELADGVLHFLARETEGGNPSTDQVAELVAKVTRELGHPDLARAFEAARRETKPIHRVPAEPSVRETAATAPHSFARPEIYTRDLISALDDGLLEVKGTDRPEAVERLVVEPRTMRTSWAESLLDEMVRLKDEVAGDFVLDSPDLVMAKEEARGWVRQLCRLLEALDRRAIVNLNVGSLPSWAREGLSGPLFFAGTPGPDAAGSPGEVARTLLDELSTVQPGRERVVVDWHVGETVLAEGKEEMQVDFASRLPHWRWALDRTGQAVTLGEGVDRADPCVLMEIGLNLPNLFQREEVEGQIERFLAKLPSLVNMAISAGVQKRAFLARAPSTTPSRLTHLRQGFLLYRARVTLVPLGLEEVVRKGLTMSSAESKASRELKQRIVKAIRASAKHHGRARNLDAAVECVAVGEVDNNGEGTAEERVRLALKRAWKRADVRRVAWVG